MEIFISGPDDRILYGGPNDGSGSGVYSAGQNLYNGPSDGDGPIPQVAGPDDGEGDCLPGE